MREVIFMDNCWKPQPEMIFKKLYPLPKPFLSLKIVLFFCAVFSLWKRSWFGCLEFLRDSIENGFEESFIIGKSIAKCFKIGKKIDINIILFPGFLWQPTKLVLLRFTWFQQLELDRFDFFYFLSQGSFYDFMLFQPLRIFQWISIVCHFIVGKPYILVLPSTKDLVPQKHGGWENDASFENESSNLVLRYLKLSTII